MAKMQFDVSELRQLERDLGKIPEQAEDRVRGVIQKAALNIKNDMISEAEAVGSTFFARVPASISYETYAGPDGWVAEVGPQIGRAQGSLAWIAYEGHATTGPRFPDPTGALEREAEAFGVYLARAVFGDVL